MPVSLTQPASAASEHDALGDVWHTIDARGLANDTEQKGTGGLEGLNKIICRRSEAGKRPRKELNTRQRGSCEWTRERKGAR